MVNRQFPRDCSSFNDLNCSLIFILITYIIGEKTLAFFALELQCWIICLFLDPREIFLIQWDLSSADQSLTIYTVALLVLGGFMSE